jgi:hypothetical protein
MKQSTKRAAQHLERVREVQQQAAHRAQRRPAHGPRLPRAAAVRLRRFVCGASERTVLRRAALGEGGG